MNEVKEGYTTMTPMVEKDRGLFKHVRHTHVTQNVNEVHKEKQQGFNARVAVMTTRRVGTMQTAYSFVVLAIVGLLGIVGWLPPVALVLVAWFSQTFLQLVLLPILSVGQNVLSQHAELMAEEQFNTTIKAEHNIEQVMQHLSAQDKELLDQTALLKYVPEMKAMLEKLTAQKTPAKKA
jgi:uncharacterized membrane protein